MLYTGHLRRLPQPLHDRVVGTSGNEAIIPRAGLLLGRSALEGGRTCVSLVASTSLLQQSLARRRIGVNRKDAAAVMGGSAARMGLLANETGLRASCTATGSGRTGSHRQCLAIKRSLHLPVKPV
jgi:hypothetical protein